MKTMFLNKAMSDTAVQPGVKVKMFIHNKPDEAEKAIAQWLKQNDVTIRHITQSQSEKGGNFVFVLAIFFHENQ